MRSDSPAAFPTQTNEWLGFVPEWDYRLEVLHENAASLWSMQPPLADDDNWLTQRLFEEPDVTNRLHRSLASSRIGLSRRVRRLPDGDDIDLDLAQTFIIERRAGMEPDPHLYSARRRSGRDLALQILVDASASTGDAAAQYAGSILEIASEALGHFGIALERQRDPFTAAAFASNGCEEVRITPLKSFDENVATMLARLAMLEPGYSTRLGAAVRYATTRMATRSDHRRVIIVLSDGQPSDIDVEDPLYLQADAAEAVEAARRAGCDIFCLALGETARESAATVFGRRYTVPVARLADLPLRLAHIYQRLSVN